MKRKIENITNNIESRNWRKNTSGIKEIYEKIIKLTKFLPENAKLNERFYCILNDITIRPKCKTCKRTYVNYTTALKGYRDFCSYKCSGNNIDTKNKIFNTYLKKYGSHPQKIESIRNKAKETCIKKYGTKFATQSDTFKEKRKKTCIKKYGVDEYSLSEDFKSKVSDNIKKAKNTCLKKYGVDHPLKNKEIKERWKNSRLSNFYNKMKDEISTSYTLMFNIISYNGCKSEYQWQCKKCNNIFSSSLKDGTRPICRVCYPFVKSLPQEEIYQYIKSLCKTDIVKQNTRSIIKNFELDIYIQSKNIAIELDGNYWHSELNGKKKTYHLNKTNECKDKNIRLLHIFEDEWGTHQNIVKSRLKHILGKTKYKIYGRKCKIKKIDVKSKNTFLNKYHIQGEDKSKVKLGAFYKNRLVAVMTFGKRKITGSKNTNWELIRYCTISNFSCVGIAGKLYKYFIKTYDPECVITYADKRWSNGNMYKQLGFILDHESAPNYWYMTRGYLSRIHRSNFQKHTLKEKLEVYDSSLSEWQNMQLNGYDRIWDCGNYVFKYKKIT